MAGDRDCGYHALSRLRERYALSTLQACIDAPWPNDYHIGYGVALIHKWQTPAAVEASDISPLRAELDAVMLLQVLREDRRDRRERGVHMIIRFPFISVAMFQEPLALPPDAMASDVTDAATRGSCSLTGFVIVHAFLAIYWSIHRVRFQRSPNIQCLADL